MSQTSRSKEIVETSIQNSYCLGLFTEGKQIGFLRVITDFATYGYLCDAFTDEKYRKIGFGQHFLKTLFEEEKFKTISWYLKTTYSQSLYERFDFKNFDSADGWMKRKSIT